MAGLGNSIRSRKGNFSFPLIDRLPTKSITQEEKKDLWMTNQNPRKLSALYERKVSYIIGDRSNSYLIKFKM